MSKDSTQRGNVLFLILIAVVLFAALSYAVTSSSRSGDGNSNAENSALQASQLDSYIASIRTAIQRMIIVGGCSDEELSFERSPYNGTDTDYLNPNSPLDFSCHIFHPSGGAVANSEFEFSDDVIFSGRNTVAGHGNDNTFSSASNELILMAPRIDLSVCQALNERNGVGAPPHGPLDITTANASTSYFRGTYTCCTSYFQSPSIPQPYAACIDPNNINAVDRNGENWFYNILLVR